MRQTRREISVFVLSLVLLSLGLPLLAAQQAPSVPVETPVSTEPDGSAVPPAAETPDFSVSGAAQVPEDEPAP
ncbi:MAG: hypothetical protein QM753_05840 [Thermomicrobiales bacterium]